VRQQSILGELGWLGYFLVLLVIAVYGANLVANALFPRHFNDKIADTLAAIFAALVFIATRAYAAARSRAR